MSTVSGLVPNARVAKVFLPPDMPGAVADDDERLKEFPRADPAKAKEFFGKSKREPLTILVRGAGSFLPEAAIAEGIRRQLAPLGQDLKIITTSNFSNDVKEADGTLRYDLFLKRTGADYAHPNTLLTPFQSGGNHYTDWQKLEGGAAIEKFEKLLAEGAGTQDEAKRTQLYLDAQKVLLAEQVVAVPLYFPRRYFRTRPWLEGLSVDPFNFLTFRAMRVKQDPAPVPAVKP
jgi:ABC-type transport system substrate-binding protein